MKKKRLKTAEKKYFDQLSGARSTWKLVEIHNRGELFKVGELISFRAFFVKTFFTFLSSSISLPSTLSSQQVVDDPSGVAGAAGSAGLAAPAAAAVSSFAGNAVLEIKIRNFRFCFMGRLSASY